MTTKVMNRKVADKFVLYKESVQDAEAEVDFLTRVYKKIRKKDAKVLREDFCGTAAVTCEWVMREKHHVGYGVDLDTATLKWGEEHHLAKMGKAVERVNLINGNVLHKPDFKADMVAALNFSYFIFKDRATMLDYTRTVLESLEDDGVFVLDIFGGPDAQIESEEETEHDDFDYIWDQDSFNPVNGHIRCHIHFRLSDGTMMRKAFTYDWRLWSVPEMTDLLYEVGFKTVDIYWEGTDQKSGEGNGVFRKSTKGDDSSSWISYIVAAK